MSNTILPSDSVSFVILVNCKPGNRLLTASLTTFGSSDDLIDSSFVAAVATAPTAAKLQSTSNTAAAKPQRHNENLDFIGKHLEDHGPG